MAAERRQALEAAVEVEMQEYPEPVGDKQSVRRLVRLAHMLEARAVQAFEGGQRTRRIPRSVLDWISSVEFHQGPIEIVEPDGTITKPDGNGKVGDGD